MCVGLGAIIRRGSDELDWLWDSWDHSPIIKSLKLKDNKPYELRDFVRIEGKPLGSLTSTDPKDWVATYDTNGGLPGWLDEPQKWLNEWVNTIITRIIPRWIESGAQGYLYLSGTQITDLGQLQSVGGYLDLSGTQITDLGQLQSVGGYLDLRGTQVELISAAKAKGFKVVLI